ncbi:hypothetical protein QOZ80_6AG0518500 [Eleusine coracana subsp. coracana]|nr:hypothetical protein QOZ80_6AG0518500 [Eleusine coracana subsp. coracana]
MASNHRLGQPFKIFCRADEEYCVTVRDDLVVLAPANPMDDYQHWYKDMRHGNEVKDEEGVPAMVLVNKATGQAIRHLHGRSHPVRLRAYDPDDEENGGIRDGAVLGLWEWHEGDNQCDFLSYSTGNLPPELASHRTMRIFCKADEEYNITARDGAVCLAPSDPSDDCQHWVKGMRYGNEIQDEEEYPAFALVNKATGEAIRHSLGQGEPVRLVPYDANELDESVMWTESKDIGDGFRCIRMLEDPPMVTRE